MKYKIIALDVDGTLVRDSGDLSPIVRDALIRAQRDYNIRVVLASGRPTLGLLSLADELELARYSGYIMPYNGGRIYSARALSAPVLTHSLDDAWISELYQMTRLHGASILSYSDAELLSEDIDSPYVQKEVAITKMPTRKLESFVNDVPRDLTKCLAVGGAECIAALESIARAQFVGRVDAFRSNPHFLELVPAGVNKGASLTYLLEKLDFDKSELIAVGDSFNDIEMIQLAGLGVAMANAHETVKQCADYVTVSNEEDGVAHLLSKYVFDMHEDVPYTVDQVNSIMPGTLMQSLGIQCTAIAKGFVSGSMPVDERTSQPLGIIHGGANLAFAETLAGLGSVALLDEEHIQVGAQVSGNHVSSAVVGDTMRGEAKIMHQGKSTHVWSVEIYSERSGKLIHTARVLNSILKRR